MKIAFCFLIYDQINLEEIWSRFFKEVDPSLYSVHVHYKTQKPLKYFEAAKLRDCIDTQWGDLSLVRAQNLLIADALKDPATTHCILLSNSCIPLKSFAQVAAHLDPGRSYFNIGDPARCFPRCLFVTQFVESRFIQKASQWCILNRKHATLVTESTDYLEWFAACNAPDEHCYITKLFAARLREELVLTKNAADSATTFTNWSDMMEYRYRNTDIGLKTYDTIKQEELTHLLSSPCLFGRKFAREAVRSLINPTYLKAIQTPAPENK
jgi:hypothetical protein